MAIKNTPKEQDGNGNMRQLPDGTFECVIQRK